MTLIQNIHTVLTHPHTVPVSTLSRWADTFSAASELAFVREDERQMDTYLRCEQRVRDHLATR